MLRKTLQKGFTLIELMVVVSIIGILMAAGILAFTNAQQSARDARRKADIDAISKAEEQYYQQNSSAYGSAAQVQTYFPANTIPKDPKTGVAYGITTSAALDKYCTCGLMEKPGTGNASNAGGAGVCTYVTGVTATYFCESQKQ